MNKYISILPFVAVLFTGCGIATVKLYDGPDLKPEQQAVISSVGFYPEQKLALHVGAIDGVQVDQTRTSEFLVLPGIHQVLIEVEKDRQTSISGGLMTSSSKRAAVTVALNAEPGDTYIPNAKIDGDRVSVSFENVGKDFKLECMPLRRFAIAYGGTADGKKAGC